MAICPPLITDKHCVLQKQPCQVILDGKGGVNYGYYKVWYYKVCEN